MNTPQDVINHWTAKLLGDRRCAQQLDAVYKFVVDGATGGRWIVSCKDPVSVSEGDGPADCTVQTSADDFVALANGALNPQAAFIMGKIKISGNINLALRLVNLF
jgi:putative sterol carrier protein